MSLSAGSSPKTRSTNIKEMLHAFKQTGRIGNSKPGNMRQAVRQAAAAAYRKARETLAGGRGRG